MTIAALAHNRYNGAGCNDDFMGVSCGRLAMSEESERRLKSSALHPPFSSSHEHAYMSIYLWINPPVHVSPMLSKNRPIVDSLTSSAGCTMRVPW